MNDYQMLDHEKIKVGDTVGVLQRITVGWGRREYRHSYAKKDVIVRITPKRTKFFGSSGQEYSNRTTFVALDDYALMENEYALRREHTRHLGAARLEVGASVPEDVHFPGYEESDLPDDCNHPNLTYNKVQPG